MLIAICPFVAAARPWLHRRSRRKGCAVGREQICRAGSLAGPKVKRTPSPTSRPPSWRSTRMSRLSRPSDRRDIRHRTKFFACNLHHCPRGPIARPTQPIARILPPRGRFAFDLCRPNVRFHFLWPENPMARKLPFRFRPLSALTGVRPYWSSHWLAPRRQTLGRRGPSARRS
jgi:hypothetical protein